MVWTARLQIGNAGFTLSRDAVVVVDPYQRHSLAAERDDVACRLTIPYSTQQENVTGFDVGFWGRAMYFEGLQANILRNDVKDGCAGIQLGIYNSVSRGDLFGVSTGVGVKMPVRDRMHR